MEITSCGVIRNENKPRVGVINVNNEKLCQDAVNDFFYEGIDVSYENAVNELEKEGLSDEEIERELEFWDSGESLLLVGDAWEKDADGRYCVSNKGTFAASLHHGMICVEGSRTTRRCHHTSPCFVMADGSGPCGDLGTDGDAVIAYDLPSSFYK